MTLRRWCLAPMIIALAACADATAPDARAPEGAVPRASFGAGFDIHAQVWIPANKTCGHYATYDGNMVSGDWEVDGVLVAQGVTGIDYTNTGAPYAVSFGSYSGGTFSAYYTEIFYPQPQSEPAMECLSLGTG
jgi:hypothetical protein